jgi:hypothetical protein
MILSYAYMMFAKRRPTLAYGTGFLSHFGHTQEEICCHGDELHQCALCSLCVPVFEIAHECIRIRRVIMHTSHDNQ